MRRTEIITDCIRPILDDLGIAGDLLFSPGGRIDSIGLLTLVVQLEERVNQAFNANIRLVTADAFSKTKSPFATVDTLADYVVELLPCPSP